MGVTQLRAMSELRANDSAEHDADGSAELEKALLQIVTHEEASPLLAASFEDTPQVCCPRKAVKFLESRFMFNRMLISQTVLVVAMGNDVLRDDGLLYVKVLLNTQLFHFHSLRLTPNGISKY